MMKQMYQLLQFTALCSILSNAIAKSYTVGDRSGWDISTDLDSWAQDKTFIVGDNLVFTFSSTHSVDEVKKEDYENCNSTKALNSLTNGNASIPLTSPGSRYFICGKNLHCLSGMKLQVSVQSNETTAPTTAPQMATSAFTSSFHLHSASHQLSATAMESLLTVLISFLVSTSW